MRVGLRAPAALAPPRIGKGNGWRGGGGGGAGEPKVGAKISQNPGGYIIGNYDYYDQSVSLADRGKISEVDLLAADPKQVAALAERIDKLFANSGNSDHTNGLVALFPYRLIARPDYSSKSYATEGCRKHLRH